VEKFAAVIISDKNKILLVRPYYCKKYSLPICKLEEKDENVIMNHIKDEYHIDLLSCKNDELSANYLWFIANAISKANWEIDNELKWVSYRTALTYEYEEEIEYPLKKYGKYSCALDELSKAIPELVPKILSGEVKISHENILEMSRLSGQNIKRLSQHLSNDTTEFVGYLRKVLPKRQDPAVKPLLTIPIGSVKDMPAYDPDAELSSLALTIPSWVMLIDRARSLTNLSEITDNARHKLEKELLGLKETIDSMLTVLKEET